MMRRKVEDRSGKRRHRDRVHDRAVARRQELRLEHDSVTRLALRGPEHEEFDWLFTKTGNAERLHRSGRLYMHGSEAQPTRTGAARVKG
jgi:hypothetical protein